MLLIIDAKFQRSVVLAAVHENKHLIIKTFKTRDCNALMQLTVPMRSSVIKVQDEKRRGFTCQIKCKCDILLLICLILKSQ